MNAKNLFIRNLIDYKSENPVQQLAVLRKTVLPQLSWRVQSDKTILIYWGSVAILELNPKEKQMEVLFSHHSTNKPIDSIKIYLNQGV